VSQHQATSFAEHAATWLYDFEFVVYVATGVVLLFYVFPAFKRFRTRGLFFMTVSFALDVFVTVFDHTIGKRGTPNPNDWWTYSLCREVVWMVAVILGTVGLLSFLRDYTRLASSADRNSSASVTPSPEFEPSKPNVRDC
jgi:hypothetical protein